MGSINTSKSSLQNLLTSLISVSNQDQNFFLPPSVFSSFVNIITAFLIDKCVSLYPDNPQLIDVLAPLVKVECVPPSGGVVALPLNYRNLLGAPSIIVKNDKSGECFSQEVPISTPQQFLNANLKGQCTRRPIKIVPQSEFDYLTTSTYKKPTHWDPIAFNIGINEKGQNQIRICPADIGKVYVMYVMQEPVCNYVAIQNPDDTFFMDTVNSVDTPWNNSAFSSLFKGLNHLYGIFSRDKQFTEWAMEIGQISIV